MPTLEPEWEEELENGPNKSTKIDFPLVHLEDNGKEYTAEDYQADTSPFVERVWAGYTPEQKYTLANLGGTNPLRNLVEEKDLDMSKVDPELLAKAKVYIDEDGIRHPVVMK